jgi:uncharacterized coiled-coil protein SlyX
MKRIQTSLVIASFLALGLSESVLAQRAQAARPANETGEGVKRPGTPEKADTPEFDHFVLGEDTTIDLSDIADIAKIGTRFDGGTGLGTIFHFRKDGKIYLFLKVKDDGKINMGEDIIFEVPEANQRKEEILKYEKLQKANEETAEALRKEIEAELDKKLDKMEEKDQPQTAGDINKIVESIKGSPSFKERIEALKLECKVKAGNLVYGKDDTVLIAGFEDLKKKPFKAVEKTAEQKKIEAEMLLKAAKQQAMIRELTSSLAENMEQIAKAGGTLRLTYEMSGKTNTYNFDFKELTVNGKPPKVPEKPKNFFEELDDK